MRRSSWVCVGALGLILGCASTDPGRLGAGAAGGGGSGGNPSGGASATGANGGSAGAPTGGAGGASLDACPEVLTARRSSGATLTVPLRLTLQGKPLLFGQENTLSDGGVLVPLNVRFYISEVQLLRNGAAPVPVDIVTAVGTPAPYGVYFFNAEEPASAPLRLLAPAGEYSGLSFLVGIKLACNQKAPESAADPLSAASQMTWPHTGYLFLRYEARSNGATGDSAGGGSQGGFGGVAQGPGPGGGAAGGGGMSLSPLAVHMGGDITQEVAPRVTVRGSYSLAEGGALEKPLSMVMDEVFRGATSDVDLSDLSPLVPPSPEVLAGERLRRELPTLQAFVFGS
ncbi:MAG: MbnP family protein [Polyangiaceae bacterium]